MVGDQQATSWNWPVGFDSQVENPESASATGLQPRRPGFQTTGTKTEQNTRSKTNGGPHHFTGEPNQSCCDTQRMIEGAIHSLRNQISPKNGFEPPPAASVDPAASKNRSF